MPERIQPEESGFASSKEMADLKPEIDPYAETERSEATIRGIVETVDRYVGRSLPESGFSQALEDIENAVRSLGSAAEASERLSMAHLIMLGHSDISSSDRETLVRTIARNRRQR